MPKSKKRKTGHHNNNKHTTNQNGDLSHEEIWDDSALIRSWNDAYAEYEYYHSIHAKGEDVEEILRQADIEDENANKDNKSRDSEVEEGEIDDDDDGDDGHEDDNIVNFHGSDAITVTDGEEHRLGNTNTKLTTKVESLAKARIGPRVFPTTAKTTTNNDESLLQDQSKSSADLDSDRDQDQVDVDAEGAMASASSSVPADQTLENLKMAYYWAGYYSGFYDGQRQTETQPQPKSRSTNQKQNPT